MGGKLTEQPDPDTALGNLLQVTPRAPGLGLVHLRRGHQPQLSCPAGAQPRSLEGRSVSGVAQSPGDACHGFPR